MAFRFKKHTPDMQGLERWLVPIVLVCVGLLQLYLAHTVELSPWKGGGFGMFAAIDSPSMRVLAAEGLSQDNQRLNLDVLDALDDSTRQRIRTLPQESDLEQLAEQLLTQEFVPIGFRRRAAYQRLQTQNPEVRVIPHEAANQGTAISDHEGEMPVYRLRRPADPISLESSTKTLKAVRLQWWRLRFNASQVSLKAAPLSQPVERGAWR